MIPANFMLTKRLVVLLTWTARPRNFKGAGTGGRGFILWPYQGHKSLDWRLFPCGLRSANTFEQTLGYEKAEEIQPLKVRTARINIDPRV
jgi:hypothetical protein